jgi:putative flippase GtrA
VRLLTSLRQLILRLLPEMTRFGTIGLFSLLVDVGGFNILRFAGGEGPLYSHPLTAKILSTAVATVVSWLGNRYWTFRHTRRAAAGHEFVMFALMSGIGSGLAVICLAISHYVLDLTSPLADNISANVVGLVLGTVFRFWAYRTHVFSERPPVDEDAQPEESALAPLG